MKLHVKQGGAMAKHQLAALRDPIPEPPLAQVLNLWNAGHDTRAISTLLFVPESMIYNMLARVAK